MWVLHKHPFSFVTPGKVATHTTENVLRKYGGWTDADTDDMKDLSLIGLIRHPISRWLSGAAMAFDCPHKPDDIDVDVLVANPVLHDDLRLQIDRFEGHPVKLFKFETMHKLWSFLGIQDHGVHLNKRRVPTLDLTKDHTESLLSFYSDDLALWKGAF